MPTYKIVWKGSKSSLEKASDLLTEALWPPAGAASLTEETGRESGDDWRLDAYFEERPDLTHVEGLLAGTEIGPGALEELPDIDWVAHALAGLGIVRAGRFALYGVHDSGKLPKDDGIIPIRIDANQAFGTGHHPTTAGCLTLLDRLAGMAPQQILDLGTGSAVLAIAAAKVWDRNVLAVDVDPKSVEIARENAGLNGVADKVDVAVADGFDHDAVAGASPFDFVFANILAGPLVDFAPAMTEHVAAGGRVMLAGLMTDQEDAVTKAYEASGFRRLNRLAHETWPVLLFVRI